MPPPEIVAFADEHVHAAAELLAARHRRHRAAEPLLPERFEDAGAARAEVERAWRADGASGAAAFDAGRLVGYLVGAPRTREVWGDNVWVELAGHAVEHAELARDLYAAAATRWVDAGRMRHYVLVPASDEGLIESWFRLCFGQQQAHAVCEVPDRTDVAVPQGFAIRGPDAKQIELLIDVELALPRHQQTSPIFSSVPLPTRDEVRAEWVSTLAGDDEQILLGVREGRPVACWALVPSERAGDALMRPEHACYLSFAATLPEARGSGVGVALTEASFAWARAAGYSAMVTDWRVTNVLASRFWPRRGFRSAFLRLYRHIP